MPRHQEGVDLGLVSAATILPHGWTAELKIPLKPLGWDGDPRKIRGNFYSILERAPSAAIGVHSCRKPKRRTFISRSFFNRCFSVNRSEEGDDMKRRDFLKISGGLSAHIDGRRFAAFRSPGRGRHRLADRRAAGGAGSQKGSGFDSRDQNLRVNMTFPSASEPNSRRGCGSLPEVPRRSARRSFGPSTMELVLPSARAVIPMRDFRRVPILSSMFAG